MADYLTDGLAPAWRPWVIDLPSNEPVPGTATSVADSFAIFRGMLTVAAAFLEDGELARRVYALTDRLASRLTAA